MTAPSPDHIAILREYFEAFNRRDVEGWVELNHPEVEMVPTPYWAPLGTTYHGRAGVRTYAHEMFRRSPYLQSELLELRDLGDLILGRGTVLAGRDRATATARTIAVTYMLREGMVYRVEAFTSEAEALEAAQWRSRDAFGLIFEHASDAALLSNGAGTIVNANFSACRLFGLSPEELLDRAVIEFVAPELVGPLAEFLKVPRSHRQLSCESEVVSSTGDRHSIELRATADFLPGLHLVLLLEGGPATQAEPPVQQRLTPREREVFRLLALGFTGSEVAERLVLSPYTVRRHVEKGITRLGAKNRVQAIALALTSGEIDL